MKRCLRHTTHLGCVPQAAVGSVHSALCSLHGVQTLPGHRLVLSFVFSAAFFYFSGLLSLDDKATYTAVYDRYSSQSATFLFFARSADNWLLRMFSPLGDVFVSAPVELSLTFLRLLVLRLGLNSHSHKHGGLFFGAVRFPPSLGDSPHAVILSSAAFCCRCLPSVPWC